jgi:hypothetical protein
MLELRNGGYVCADQCKQNATFIGYEYRQTFDCLIRDVLADTFENQVSTELLMKAGHGAALHECRGQDDMCL